MRVTIVYESLFGCTRTVAERIADGMRERCPGCDVAVQDVTTAPDAAAGDTDLLVLAGPTHAFGMSRPSTRADAVRQGAVGSATTGLREWIAGLPQAGPDRLVACADTRVSRPRVPGSAARKAARALRSAGYRTLLDPSTFWVEATPGPLRPGEEERARQWGAELAGELLARRAGISGS